MVWHEGISKVNVSRLSLSCSISMTLCCSVFTVLLQLLNNGNRRRMLDPQSRDHPLMNEWKMSSICMWMITWDSSYTTWPGHKGSIPNRSKDKNDITALSSITSGLFMKPTHCSIELTQAAEQRVSIQPSSYNPRVSVNGVERGRKEAYL